MSADTLRRAATLIRDRAGAATPAPWTFSDETRDMRTHEWSANVTASAWDIACCPGGDTDPGEADRQAQARADAAHIAAWDPTTALAVADWLEIAAAQHDRTDYLGRISRGTYYQEPWVESALAVAHAYLGEEA